MHTTTHTYTQQHTHDVTHTQHPHTTAHGHTQGSQRAPSGNIRAITGAAAGHSQGNHRAATRHQQPSATIQASEPLPENLSVNIKRIKIIGNQHRFVVYPVSKKSCYKQATQERFSVDVALTPKDGLEIMVSDLTFTTPRCFEQRWGGLLSPYFSELNYNLKPDEVSNFIMYLPLPSLKESERDTFLI